MYEKVRKVGRVPHTSERRALERKRTVRELVFGLQDGILTTLGVLVGIDTAGASDRLTLIAAIIAGLTGTISMAAGEYLGTQAEAELFARISRQEKDLLLTNPQGELAEQISFLETKGFSPREAKRIARKLMQSPEVWQNEMLRDEYGIEYHDGGHRDALHSGLYLGGAFGIGSLILILSYAFSHGNPVVAGCTAFALLFGAGYGAGNLAGSNPLWKGLQLTIAGGLLFGFSYLAGKVFLFFQ